jgi:hypothetical protein
LADNPIPACNAEAIRDLAAPLWTEGIAGAWAGEPAFQVQHILRKPTHHRARLDFVVQSGEGAAEFERLVSLAYN